MKNKKNKSEKTILLGNEAIVQGALEAGVQFISTYPGTPASEIGDNFSALAKKGKGNFYFEYSVNEKVALEAAIGASFSGLKCLVAMKSFGLNVCLDSLIPFCYTGSNGPAVIVAADDPSCHSSGQSEENSRAFALLAHIPILEPSDPQECKDFTKLAFQISKKFKIPVIIRTTTRVAHQRMPVSLGEINSTRRAVLGKFVRDPEKFVTLPPRVLEMHGELLDKIERIKLLAEQSKINRIYGKQFSGKSKLGIISSGIAYLHTAEALKELGLNLPILKLGFFHPLPEKKIKAFIKKLDKIFVVEELEPYLEREIRMLAKEVNPKLQIFGKSHLPEVGELRPESVLLALSKISKKPYSLPSKLPLRPIKHPPRFCIDSGAFSYWPLVAAIKQASPRDTIYGGDIGCYMITGLAPHKIQDYLSCMGSSIGIAHGITKTTKQKVIAFIGDGTFFHAGIPALINAVYNKSNPLIIVFDNRITAMTGLQPNPGMGKTGMGEDTVEIKIEEVARACGVKHLKVIDYAENPREMTATIKEFLAKDEVSMIVARHPCWLLEKRSASG